MSTPTPLPVAASRRFSTRSCWITRALDPPIARRIAVLPFAVGRPRQQHVRHICARDEEDEPDRPPQHRDWLPCCADDGVERRSDVGGGEAAVRVRILPGDGASDDVHPCLRLLDGHSGCEPGDGVQHARAPLLGHGHNRARRGVARKRGPDVDLAAPERKVEAGRRDTHDLKWIAVERHRPSRRAPDPVRTPSSRSGGSTPPLDCRRVPPRRRSRVHEPSAPEDVKELVRDDLCRQAERRTAAGQRDLVVAKRREAFEDAVVAAEVEERRVDRGRRDAGRRERPASATATRRSGCGNGSGRSSTASTTLKTAELTPMPSASVSNRRQREGRASREAVSRRIGRRPRDFRSWPSARRRGRALRSP